MRLAHATLAALAHTAGYPTVARDAAGIGATQTGAMMAAEEIPPTRRIVTTHAETLTLWLGDQLLGVVARHPQGWVGLTGSTTHICHGVDAALFAVTQALRDTKPDAPEQRTNWGRLARLEQCLEYILEICDGRADADCIG